MIFGYAILHLFFTNKELKLITLVSYFVNTFLTVHWFGNPGLRGGTRNRAIPIMSGNISPAYVRAGARVILPASPRHEETYTELLLDYRPSSGVNTGAADLSLVHCTKGKGEEDGET